MKGVELQQLELGRSAESHNDSDPLLQNQADASSTEEIVVSNDDIENVSVPCCRICLETDCEPGDELISPCMCKGTQQFVHRSCLDHWRSVKEGFAFSHCTTCKAQFHLRVALLEDNSWRKIKFRLFVTRDIVIVFFAVQI
ncbi:RING/FYVE/PHD ZINC FINGER SUPERFAMILY PROTEIN, partial [Salix koriyanagi]